MECLAANCGGSFVSPFEQKTFTMTEHIGNFKLIARLAFILETITTPNTYQMGSHGLDDISPVDTVVLVEMWNTCKLENDKRTSTRLHRSLKRECSCE